MKKQKEIFDAISLECSKITTKRYSTSFSLAIKLLSREYQNAIYSIYGFVRLADEIVDSFHDYNKSKLLNELRSSTIEAIEKNISLNPILNSFQHIVKKYNIEWALIDRFLDSMEYDLNSQTCTEEAYKRYIQGSAEAVGLMCLQIFTNNKKGKYQQLKPYAESLGSAFQKINFLRDINEDYDTLNRVYFPNLNITAFSNAEKKIIENDIAKDFSHGLIGIRLLDKNARKGVYLAYKYYMSLFHKIKKMQAQEILVKRIRVSNLKKIMILIYSQIEIRLRI
tara:strand:- start:1869 stop:2711 length:843 start_codon:yes stop_codon:yes gene_type:complete